MPGKGDTLDFLRSKLPDLPIPAYRRMSIEALGNTKLLRQATAEIGYPMIVRSDAPCEDGLGRSFAGMFNSITALDPESITSAIHHVAISFDRQKITDYANMRRDKTMPLFTAPDAIPVILQKYEPGKLMTVITKHPHDESYIIDFDEAPRDAPFRDAHAFRVESIDDFVKQVNQWFQIRPPYHENGKALDAEQLAEALRTYQRIEELFDDSISFQMEASTVPHRLFQWRPFRRREIVAFSLDDVAPPADRKTIFDVASTIGITPPEGMIFRHIAMDWFRRDAGIDAVMKANMYQQQGELLAVSSGRLGSFNWQMGQFDCYFKLRLFSGGDAEPWQTHDAFRVLEEPAMAGFFAADLFPFDECKMQYWSDGKSGRMRFFPGTQIDMDARFDFE